MPENLKLIEGSRQQNIRALLTVTIPNISGSTKGAVGVPSNPQKWAEELIQSVTDNGEIELCFDTLAYGVGGCKISFQSSTPTKSTDNFEVVVARETLEAIARAIWVCLKEMD